MVCGSMHGTIGRAIALPLQPACLVLCSSLCLTCDVDSRVARMLDVYISEVAAYAHYCTAVGSWDIMCHNDYFKYQEKIKEAKSEVRSSSM